VGVWKFPSKENKHPVKSEVPFMVVIARFSHHPPKPALNNALFAGDQHWQKG
jgi:hypothetical protein